MTRTRRMAPNRQFDAHPARIRSARSYAVVSRGQYVAACHGNAGWPFADSLQCPATPRQCRRTTTPA